MKKQLLIFIIIISSICTFSQTYQVPKEYKLVLAEDYAPYEEDVIKTVDWLISTSINEQAGKRTEANTFLLKWLLGSPKVSIGLTNESSKFDCQDCLMIFMGAWAKDNIIKNEYDNSFDGNYAGVNAVIDFYLNNKKELKKNKAVEKMIKLKNKGKLESYIREKMVS